MTINLTKGGDANLSAQAPSLTQVLVGLGWKPPTGLKFDLDASAFLLNASRKVPAEPYFVFYNNLSTPEGSVVHQGDDRTGDRAGDRARDNEEILINLLELPDGIETIVLTVTIDEANVRGQNFGQVRNAFIRVVNRDDNQELIRYDLGEDFSTETALIFGELYRHGDGWRFRAVGQGYDSGLAGLVREFGLTV